MPQIIRRLFLFGAIGYLSIGNLWAKTEEATNFSLVQLYPFLHGFLFIGFGYSLLFYFLSSKRLGLTSALCMGVLSVALRVYTNPHFLSVGFHLLLLGVVVVLAYQLKRLISPLQAQKQILENTVAQQWHELAHERANMEAVMESTPDLIYSLDKNFRFLTMNTATRKTFALFYNQEVTLGDDYNALSSPEIAVMMKPLFARAFAGEFVEERISYTFHDITYHREIYLNPIREENGEITGVSVFSKDISSTELVIKNLQYSESILESTFDQSPDALFLLNSQNFSIIRCNHRALQLFETDDEMMILGKSGVSFNKEPLSFDEQKDIVRELIRNGIWANEYEYRTFKGNVFWGILKISMLSASANKTILARISDITERKQKEANLRAILESNDQSIWLVDCNGVLIDHNQVFVDMLLQTFGLELQPKMDMVASLPYIYQTMWKLRYKRVMKGERQEFVDAYEYNGIEYVYQITGFPVSEDDQSKPTRASFFARDITQQVMAERKLRSSQRLLDSINQHLQDALFRTTPNGTLLYANMGFLKMFGFQELEIYGIDVRTLHQNSRMRFRLQRLLIREHSFQNEETQMIRKDGTVFWASISATQNYDEYGNVYYDGIIRDITEARKAKIQLKKRNKKLKKVNNELDRFVYSASHDLRAPLSSLLGLLDLLRLVTSEEEKQHLLGMMLKSVQKLDEFINQIIHYSRNSRISLKVEKIEVQALLEDVFENLKYMPNNEKVAHLIDLQVETPFYSDYFRLSVVLNNLISNAIRYANLEAEQPFVKVSIHITKEKVFIEVGDNGQGIAEEYLPHIFKMFYRASEQNTGSGIGLYILKETLEVLKGKIQVHSSLGVGTTFILEIPNMAEPQHAG